MSYQWYDAAGRQYDLTPRQVSALVRKHDLPHRKIYGQLAVDVDAWQRLMAQKSAEATQPQAKQEAML